MQAIVSIDGHITSATTPAVTAVDRGLLLGDGVFETMKGANGAIWYLNRHLARLSHAAGVLGLSIPSQLPEWIDAVARTAFAEHETIRVRVTITRGVSPTYGLTGTDALQPTVVVLAIPLPAGASQTTAKGITATLAKAPRNERAYTAGIKCTSYVESIMALRDATAQGYDDALVLDTRGMVSETTACNIFAVIDGTLVTPSLSCGPLPGISRAVVLELAQKIGVATAEREFPLSELLRASESFITNATRGIVPLASLDGHRFGDGSAGPVTRSLQQAYATVGERV